MIWYAPGFIRSGISPDIMTQNIDIFPTLLDLAGIEIPGHLAGRSLKSFLQGKTAQNDNHHVFAYASYSDFPDNYWENPEPYFNPKSEVPFHTRIERISWRDEHHTAMIRDRDWKLIINATHDPELYKLDGAFIERENIYGQSGYRQKFIELENKINDIKKMKYPG
jgi:arylsulfatase A-like enzyme